MIKTCVHGLGAVESMVCGSLENGYTNDYLGLLVAVASFPPVKGTVLKGMSLIFLSDFV